MAKIYLFTVKEVYLHSNRQQVKSLQDNGIRLRIFVPKKNFTSALRASIEYIPQKTSSYQQAQTTVLSVRKLPVLLLVINFYLSGGA